MLRLLPLLLLAAPLAAAPVAPEPKRVPDVAAFPAAFGAAVGEHFEFLGGERARIRSSMGSYSAERYWVAKVKPRAAGRYVFSYQSTFHWPEIVTKQWKNKGGDAEYTFRIAVGEAGSPRVIQPGGYGGSAYPHLNVGDTLLIPVHADPFRDDHRFAPVRKLAAGEPGFDILAERTAERYLKGKADPPVVANAAGAHAKLLGTWIGSFGNRPGTATSHSLGAVLEFTTPGTFNLGGRLAAGKADVAGAPFRVLAKDRPAVVLMESLGYVESNGKFRSSSTSAVRPGTIEARVGDLVIVGAGGYHTSGLSGPDRDRTGVVEALPFHDVPHYEPR